MFFKYILSLSHLLTSSVAECFVQSNALLPLNATADLTVFVANVRNLNLQYVFKVDSVTSLQTSVAFGSYLAMSFALSTCEEWFYADRCKMVNEHS